MENLKEKNKKKNLAIIILFAFLAISIALGWLGILNNFHLILTKQKISPEEAGRRAIEYINENLLRKGDKAILKKVSYDKISDLYKIELSIKGVKFTSYITKNGKVLFPEGIEIEKKKKITQKTDQNKIKPEKIAKAELFVMAFCPYGNQAENAIIPVVKLIGKKADIQLHYVISKDSEGNFHSLHGIKELNQDIRELCVAKYQKEKLWGFIEKINEETTLANVDKKWEGIAKRIGIDVKKIKNCQKNEAEELLEREYALNQKYKVTASPTLIINGTRYQGERTPEAYKKAICSGFINPPKECEEKLSANIGKYQ